MTFRIQTISKISTILFFLGVGLSAPLKGQSLTDLRKEIDRLEKTLKGKENQERSLLELVEDLNREIGLRQTLLSRLESEKKSKERQIAQSQRNLSKAEVEFGERKAQVSKRLVSMYKRGTVSDLEILLSVSNFNQALVWLRYQKRILEHHQRSLQQLLAKRQEIMQINQRLGREKTEKEQLIAEVESEKKKLEDKKEAQKGPLSRLRKDKDAIQRQIEERKRAYAQIEKRIVQEEARKKTPTEIKRLDNVGFAKLQGRLPWPVSGRIDESFGMHKHPISKTEYENRGIDIKTEPNANVGVVADGRVISILWVPSFGNVVLVDHGGYYTVYSQLVVVDVASGDYLTQGDIIGQVGDTQSLYGATLHFEVWKGGEKYLNPITWLGKS